MTQVATFENPQPICKLNILVFTMCELCSKAPRLMRSGGWWWKDSDGEWVYSRWEEEVYESGGRPQQAIEGTRVLLISTQQLMHQPIKCPCIAHNQVSYRTWKSTTYYLNAQLFSTALTALYKNIYICSQILLWFCEAGSRHKGETILLLIALRSTSTAPYIFAQRSSR